MVSSTSLHHDWCYLRHCRNAHSMRKWLSQSILRILTGRIQIIIIINRLLIWIRLFTSMIDFYSSLTLEIIRIISYWTDRLLFLTDNEVVICVDCQQQNEYSLYDLYLFIHYWYWQCLRRLYWSFSCHIIILRAMPYDREGLSLSAYINNNPSVCVVYSSLLVYFHTLRFWTRAELVGVKFSVGCFRSSSWNQPSEWIPFTGWIRSSGWNLSSGLN